MILSPTEEDGDEDIPISVTALGVSFDRQPPVVVSLEGTAEFDRLLDDADVSIELDEGSPLVMQDGVNSPAALKDFLVRNNAIPRKRIFFAGSEYWISAPMMDGASQRPFFVAAYTRVKNGKRQLFMRVVYKGNSAAGWRIPDRQAIGGWIGKGLRHLGQSMTDIPAEISLIFEAEYMRAYNNLPVNNVFYKILALGSGEHANIDQQGTVLANIGGRIADIEAMERWASRNKMKSSDAYALLPPDRRDRVIHIGDFAQSGIPESFQFSDPGLRPDQLVETYDGYAPLYGRVRYYRVLSADKRVQYIFCGAMLADGKGGVKGAFMPVSVQATDRSLNRFGQRAIPIMIAQDAMVALYEYPQEVPYGNDNDFAGAPHPNDYDYVDASAWVMRGPLVRAFIENIMPGIIAGDPVAQAVSVPSAQAAVLPSVPQAQPQIASVPQAKPQIVSAPVILTQRAINYEYTKYVELGVMRPTPDGRYMVLMNWRKGMGFKERLRDQGYNSLEEAVRAARVVVASSLSVQDAEVVNIAWS